MTTAQTIKPFTLTAVPMPPLEIARILESGSPAIDRYLGDEIYANSRPEYLAEQRKRLAETARLHAQRVGGRPTYLLRAPGRLNAFLEYLDMCAGDHMSTTIDGDIPVAISPREDDILNAANANTLFPAEEVSLHQEFERFTGEPLAAYGGTAEDDWDNRTLLIPHFGHRQGHWMNYLLSPYLRIMWECRGIAIRGADVTFGRATAPFRAGTSSSSAVVVLSFLSLYLANQDRLPAWDLPEICRLLGEAEWYVGTHGGANDQTTILRNSANSVLYNRHSRVPLDSTPLPFLQGVHVVLANSLWEVNKSLTGNQSFNMRKGWMEIGNELMKLIISAAREALKQGKATRRGWLAELLGDRFGFKAGGELPLLESHPEYWEAIETRYNKFGSLDPGILGIPDEAIQELILTLPVKITPEEAVGVLGMEKETIERLYTRPKREIGGYHARTTARFFYKENLIGRELERIFLEAERRIESGELSPDAAEYDHYRVTVGELVDQLQHVLSYDFRVSNPQLDRLLNIARRGPGYLGGKLTGAGKGGCVSILVRERDSLEMCRYLDREYYGKLENFDDYRQILEDALRYYEVDSFERGSAAEQLDNLNRALQSIPEQRRVITFSRGACALDLR
jgi:galactokinase